MRDPDMAVILDCGHVEHPQDSGWCQTTDCINSEPTRITLYEWGSMIAIAGMVFSVRLATDRWLMEIIMDNLPRLFTS